MRLRAVAAAALIACTGHHASPPPTAASAGVVISLYSSGPPESAYAVVDDRRWVDVTGKELVLEHIESGASLASLVIEPLAGAPLAITRCTREALPEPPPSPPIVAAKPQAKPPDGLIDLGVPEAPRELALRRLREKNKQLQKQQEALPRARVDATVRCTAEGAPGRHLVRILYVSTKLVYRVQHDITVTAPDRAQIATRFAIPTPAWGEHADVIAYDGVPGGQRLPTEVVRGAVALDGSIAILTAPPREKAARIRRIFDGAVVTPSVDVADAAWNSESSHAVWVWLEVPSEKLAPGPVRVHVALPDDAVHDLELPSGVRGESDRDDLLRLPLWSDTQLTGMRQRFTDPSSDPDANGLAERLLLSVANLGDTPREVWIEEHVRSARHRKIERAWPKRPASIQGGDIVREQVVIKPHEIARVGYTVEYAF